MKGKSLSVVLLLGILVISVFPVLPYFHSGYFPTHDGEWAVVRLSEMFRELRDHQIPPRISSVLNFEYGYPLFNFAYPFPYYLGIVFHFLKFNFVSSIKILFAVSVPLSGLGMYFAARKVWKSNTAACISSVLYIYFPYRFVDLYVRGSLGESLSFVLFPLLFYLAFCIYEDSKNTWYIFFFSVLYAALIMTHNIMAVLFSIPLLVLILAISYENRKAALRLLVSLVFGVLLSSFFMIPALLEKSFILLSKIPIADRSLYFVTPSQLIIPSWGYGVPTDLKGAFSYQIGWPHALLFIIVIVLLVFHARRRGAQREFNFRLSIAFSIVVLVFLCLLFSPTLIIWKNTPLLSEINYPWTLLGPLGFLISLIGGYSVLHNKYLVYGAVLLASCSVFFFLPYARPSTYVNRGETYYSTNEGTTTSSSELMPLWVKVFPTSAPKQLVELPEGGSLANVTSKSNRISFNINLPAASQVTINRLYYPGWVALIDNEAVPISYSTPHGVMQLLIPTGLHHVVLVLKETPLRLFADILSIASFAMLLIYCLLAPKLKLSL